MAVPEDPPEDVEGAAMARIGFKLDRARRLGLFCFGSKAHGFRLRPTLPEVDAAAFEAMHGVTLPSGYRRFLIEAGNGGAGSEYGITPLDQWDVATTDDEPGYLARPSPFDPDATWEEWSVGDKHADRFANFQGTVHLADRGCAMCVVLVASGPQRGRVVYVNRDPHGHPPSFEPDAGFLEWYERWLDDLLRPYPPSGLGPESDEPALMSALAGDASRPTAVHDVLVAMMARSTATPAALAAVVPLTRDPSEVVRRLALGVLTAHRSPAAATAAVQALLHDSDGVYEAALYALTDSRDAAAMADVRAHLGDPDDEVARRAVRVLADAARLTWADVRAMWHSARAVEWMGAFSVTEKVVEAADAARWLAQVRADGDVDDLCLVLSHGAHRDADGRVVPILIELTAHADAKVRLRAAVCLGRIGDPAGIPALERIRSDPGWPHYTMPSGQSYDTVRSVGRCARDALKEIAAAVARR
jgi:hypothetical protein